MKSPTLLSLLLFGCLAVSCKRNDPTPASLAEANQRQDRAKDRTDRWFVDNVVGAYERVGRHDPQWDGPAKVALNLMAAASANRAGISADWKREAASMAQAAVDKGCPDPLVRYAALRYGIHDLNQASQAEAAALKEIAQEMDDSNYPPRLKLYAAERAADAMRSALPDPKDQTQAELFALDNMLQNGLTHLIAALGDKTTPPEELYTMCLMVLMSPRRNQDAIEDCWQKIDSALGEARSKSNVQALVKGYFHIKYAWKARGGGYASQVSAEGARLFEERLKIAEKALLSAWDQDNTDTRPATLMLEVCVGLGKDRPEMERWFQRAMLTAPNNYEACSDKLHYLKPMWFGSPEEMLAFGHECVTNTAWTGTVPLVLVDVHDFFAAFQNTEAERNTYWLHPKVWPDVRAAYEEFFRRNPDAVGYRHNYVRFAYKCRAWDDLNAQLRLLGPINYDFFGGQEAFSKLLAEARKHAKP